MAVGVGGTEGVILEDYMEKVSPSLQHILRQLTMPFAREYQKSQA